MSVFAFIFKYLRKTKVMVSVILVAIVVRSVADRGEIYAMSQTIGLLPQYTNDKSVLQGIIFYIGLLAFFLVVEGISNYIWRYMGGKFQPYFSSLVYKDIFTAVHHQSVTFFNEEMAGKVASKTKNIVSGIRDIYGHLVFGVIRPVTGIFVSLFLICRADWLTGICISILNMIFMAAIIFIRRKIGSFAEKRARFHAETDGVFIDTVTNSDLVKSFANYFYEKSKFYIVLRKAVRSEQEERTKDALFDLEGKCVFYGAYLLSCISVFYSWYIGRLVLADVVMTTALLNGLMMEVNNIGFFAGEFAQLYGQVKDGLELVFQPSLVNDAPDAHNIRMRGKAIKFSNISYHYNNKDNIFDKFNLHIID